MKGVDVDDDVEVTTPPNYSKLSKKLTTII